MVAKENPVAAAVTRFGALRRAAGQLTTACVVRNSFLSRTQADRVNSPTPKKPEAAKKPDFERSLARLEEVVRRLESPQLSLDDAMRLFEEGVALSRECQKQLEEAEGRVEILLKKADGKLAAEPFDPERESDS
jgi:exodeoxyribonuclease VII small subunit